MQCYSLINRYITIIQIRHCDEQEKWTQIYYNNSLLQWKSNVLYVFNSHHSTSSRLEFWGRTLKTAVKAEHKKSGA